MKMIARHDRDMWMFHTTRSLVKTLKAKACIKPHKSWTTKKRYDKERYKHRNHVQRSFGRIKQFCRVATRYKKTARISPASSGSQP